MFDLGIQELVLIFVVALIVFGPKRLPEIAHAMGKGLAEMKRALSGVKDQIDSELRDVKDIKELKDLDPIALKNELFKGETFYNFADKPAEPKQTVEGSQEEPQQKVEGIQEEPQQKTEGSQEESQQKVEGSLEDRQALLNEVNKAQKALILARSKLAALKPEAEQQKSGEKPDQSPGQDERKVQG